MKTLLLFLFSTIAWAQPPAGIDKSSGTSYITTQGYNIQASPIVGQQSDGTIWPIQTDGQGRLVVSTQGSSMAIVTQGPSNDGSSPWHVIDDTFIADFNAWKGFADANLSTLATEATLAALNAKVTTTANGIKVDGSAIVQPVSGSIGRTWTLGFATDSTDVSGSSVSVSNFPASFGVTQITSPWVTSITGTVPLPTGAATEATLSSLNSKVVVADTGNVTVVASALPSGAATESTLSALNAKFNSLGQKTMAASAPVVIASDQSAIPVTQSTSPWVISGNVNASQSGVWTTGRTWTLLNSTDSVNAVQSGTWTVQQGTPPWSVSQSGNWSFRLQDGSGNLITSQTNGAQRALDIGINVAGVQVDPRTRTWTLSSGTDSVASVQSGAWTTGRTWTLSSVTDSVNIGNFPATQAVTQSTSPWVISGTVTANAGTNLNTSALALDTTVSALQVSQGSTTSGEKGTLTLGAVTTAAPTYTTAQSSPLSITTAGALRVDGSAVTQPISGTVTSNQGTSPWVNNISQFGGSNVVTGTGNSGAGIPRVTVSNDSSLTNISGTISLPTNAAQETGGHLAAIDTDIDIALSSRASAANQTNGTQKTQIVDPSNNSITSQANGSQRALDVGIDVSGVQVDPRTIGVVQTSAPTPKSNTTVTQVTTDDYARQVILLPETINAFWGQMFHASSNSAVLSGTTETAFLSFQNPNASGKTARIYRFSIGPTLGNNFVTYRFYIDATVTANGTGITEVGNRQTSQASNVVNVFTLPTVSANGSLIKTEVMSGLNGNGRDVLYNFSLLIEANHNLLVTRQLSANATIGGVNIEWVEQ